eukprot:14114238-Heterocapsa_arctica.AAC.1
MPSRAGWERSWSMSDSSTPLLLSVSASSLTCLRVSHACRSLLVVRILFSGFAWVASAATSSCVADA